MNEQITETSTVLEVWKCPKCGANNRFNPNICTSCNYSKIPPVEVLPPKSRQVWESISFVMMIAMIALQLFYAVSFYLGFGLTYMYDIKGHFLDIALKYPDMLLYSHFATAGICLLLALWNGYDLFKALKNRSKLTESLSRVALTQFAAVWMFPVVNIITDLIVTSMTDDKGANYRSFAAYDLFDMGISVLVPLIISGVALVIMYVNNRLAPEDNTKDEE